MTTMLMNLTTLHGRRGRGSEIALLWLVPAIQRIPPDLRALAGTGEVRLLHSQDDTLLREEIMLAWAAVAARQAARDSGFAESYVLSALGARERQALGGFVPLPTDQHSSVDSAIRPGCSVPYDITDADASPPMDNDGWALANQLHGRSALVYGFANDTLVIWTLRPDLMLSSGTYAALTRVAATKQRLIRLAASDDSVARAGLAAFLFPPEVASRLPASGPLLLAPDPAFPPIDYGRLWPSGSGSALGSRFDLSVDPSLAQLVARPVRRQ